MAGEAEDAAAEAVLAVGAAVGLSYAGTASSRDTPSESAHSVSRETDKVAYCA